MSSPTPASGDLAQGGDVIRAAARAFERDRYLAALLARAAARGDLVALAAFAGELQRIPGYVSEPMAGEIRLQWWRDTLEAGLASGLGSTGHPIADAICDLARRHGIGTAALHALIDAVGDRLDDTPFQSMDALTANLGNWDGGLFSLALNVIRGTPPRGEEGRLLQELGALYGLARTIAEIPVELAQGRIVLPGSLLGRHGIDAGNARSAAIADRWRSVVAELIGDARRQLEHSVQRYQEAPRDLRLAALPIALVRPYLAVTQRADVTALEAPDMSPLKRVWQIWRVSRTGRP